MDDSKITQNRIQKSAEGDNQESRQLSYRNLFPFLSLRLRPLPNFSKIRQNLSKCLKTASGSSLKKDKYWLSF